jgi:hypothetical protein
MSEVRIVKLGPVSDGIESVSFEDAFGEYSYAGGRGRARRKARKLERIANRQEVRGARREARQEERGERVAGRQAIKADRIAGRTELQLARKGKRLAKREMGTESRIGRRMQRADARAYKRSLRNPSEAGLDQAVPQEMNDAIEQGGAPVTAETGGGYDTGGYDDGGISGGQTGQGNYYGDETQSDGAEYGSGDDGYDDGSYDVEPELDGAYEQGYQDASEDYNYEDVEVDQPFDGVMGAEDRFNEMQDTNDIVVNPTVQDMADKCVWNEKLIETLKNQRKNATGNPQEISKTILVRAKRLKDLNDELIDYANACGNYSNMDGDAKEVGRRKKEVLKARRRAKAKTLPRRKHFGGDATSVDADLNPVLKKNRIVVPAETASNATGTGINGLDNIDDFDAPEIREVYLGADGSFTKGIDLGSIALGVLITVSFIALNKKYNWIKM